VRGQSSIVAIKPCGRGLLMETLRYTDELKKAERAFDNIAERHPAKDLLDLGEELIKKKSSKFHPEKFKDSYTVALRELIAAKQERRPPREIEDIEPASNVIDLMDALRRSVKGGSGSKPAAKSKLPKAKITAKKSAKRKNSRHKSAA
jgi:DNA end-binding protein Ku